ncbi:lytic murein transglycosylase [Meridianimarinicoccus sp. MJW13]|uniref:lytic murein transglycosylase n=1 Tax=Meridianimarinicoccus sp. MJW13 TaxID=2720031 RepID=UPI00186956FD|nr:lytic murein transglycosylase [Fluviibacterium sp. MJW13]
MRFFKQLLPVVFSLTATALVAESALVSQAANVSPRPVLRPEVSNVTSVSVSNLGFERWLNGFRSRARAQGISDQTLNAAFSGIRYNTNVISRDRNQSEFTKALWEYLDSAVSNARINNGRAAYRKYQQTLAAIERKYDVEAEVVVAIWGLESAYGTYRGNNDVVEALATLAYDGRRGNFFEEQLIASLKILQAGDVAPRNMIGSWAGAMGHTQFIPTSYLAYAVDFSGDGKRDIWSNDPTDALASTAAYLSRFGWKKGQPWGVEVRLPSVFNYGMAGHGTAKTPRQWAALGVRGMDGQPVPNHGRASILLPAGSQGPAFMIFKNFNVIERYNAADSYVIAVGHLSDRIKGKPDFIASWPRGDRTLRLSERKELQQRLSAAGYSTGGVDGLIGPNTIDAIRDYQKSAGLVPDGYASVELLKTLR